MAALALSVAATRSEVRASSPRSWTRPLKARLTSSETVTGESAGTASIRSSRSPSSSIASGFPPVARCSRSSWVRRTGPVALVTSSRAASTSRPDTSSVGRLAQTAAPGSPARTVTRRATASDSSRRAANTSASADGLVDQVPVVDEYGEGPVLGGPAQEAQGRRARPRTGWARRRRPGAEQQCGRERRGLRGRDLVEQRQHRPEQLEEPGERDELLGLHALRAQHLHLPDQALGLGEE